MPNLEVHTLLETAIVRVWDVCCPGIRREQSDDETVSETQLVFPYRGAYVWHVAGEEVVAEANQVLFFNAGETFRVSHPVAGGDACLVLAFEHSLLKELAPSDLLASDGAKVSFKKRRLRIDPRAQVLVALLRHSLREELAEPLEAEGLALTLLRRAISPQTAHEAGATEGRQKLVDRAKLVLAADPGRRWTLAEVAAEVRCSPVYLTQVFQQVEGVPLYRYQLRLRLSRSLLLLADYDDLTALSLDLGFTSHSHFTAAFREAYGRTPSEFRESALRRQA